MNRAVFIDRDNTIIHNDADLGDPQEVRLMQGAAAGIASLRGLGFRIIVVTNQGGVARGKYGEDDVKLVHDRVSQLLASQANGAIVDAYYFCPFHPEGTVPRYKREHPWRKPQPGMLLQAAEDHKIDLAMSWMIGDSPRDIQAGRAAHTRTILIGQGAGQGELPLDPDARPDFTANNLVEAARIIAQHLQPPAAEIAPGAAAAKTTFPATKPLDTPRSSATRPESGQRPFKPWALQPRTDRDEALGLPDSSTARLTQPRELAEEPAVPVDRAGPVQPIATRPRPAAAPEPSPVVEESPAPPAAPEAQVASAAQVESQAQREMIEDDSELDTSTGNLLRQILRELRQRHAQQEDWSLTKMLGLGLAQPAAGFCALMAVLNVDSAQMQPWLLGGVFMQLLVITLLLIHWQR